MYGLKKLCDIMKGVMKSFLLFIAGVFVILILMQTVFGKGIAYNVLGFLAEAEPAHLQDEIRTMLTEASYAPGEYEGKIRIAFKHNVTIEDEPFHTVLVETQSQFKFTTEKLNPVTFLSNCNVDKMCTKVCLSIGKHCRVTSQCCTGLKCNYTTLICENITSCGDGILDSWEECDIGSDKIPNTVDDNNTLCPGRCQISCNCSDKVQCNDGMDNDGDGFCDWRGCEIKGVSLPPDPGCRGNSNYNDESRDMTGSICGNNIREGLEACDGTDDTACPDNCISVGQSNQCSCPLITEGDICKIDSDCIGTKCLSKVMLDQVGGILIIKKYFEGNTCRLRIMKG